MRRAELRPALYHRLHRLLPFVAPPAARRFWRGLLWAALALYFGFVLLVLALRYSVLPNIEHYRADIERLASNGLGQTVSIGRIEASWDGINPDLTLSDVRIADAEGRPALAFSRVETVLSWWSVPALQLRLRLLAIDEPTLNLRRSADGRIFVAGIPLNQENSDSDVSGWVLAQQRIRIRGATLVWEDEQRQAPALVLEDVNFGLDNNGRHHRFGLSALPPEALAARIDLRGDFRGRDLDTLGAWKGQLFAEVDYTDLAVWQQWIDYPVALPQGRGALRAWIDFADGAPRGLTADLALQDVRLRLSPRLPALALEHMQGRLTAKLSERGWQVGGRAIELATLAASGADEPRAAGEAAPAAHPAISIAPTDFLVDWNPDADGKQVRGSATASALDLDALTALAAYLPLDAHTRQLLADFAPRGRFADLRASWRGDAEALRTYALKARFDDLALKANGYFPGFSGLSGTVDTSEQGGSATLRSDKATLDLPSVFPEAAIALDTLNAQAKWKISKGELDAELTRVEFAGPDAAGSAQGRYRHTGEGPGTIDLTAALTRADGRAVWRYMPHAVNANARHWLRDALIAGTSSEAKLVLKGDLAHFPFVDKQHGQFLVTAKAHGVTLDYATGWPKITGIDGDLRFEGAGIVVDAQRGALLGAQLSHTRAEIADFDADVSVLTVKGRAEGPTAEFLKFIEQSPVGERIDHFTEDMRAAGNGRLDLGLSIPLDLALIDNSKVDGAYRFQNNEVTVDPGLPPLKQVNGTLTFTASELNVPEITATLFGGPLRIKGASQPDGKVLITANGTLSVDQMRRQSDLPLLDHLSGSTAYRGEVRVRKRSADLVVESTLGGIASSLPAPLNKSAAETLPLRFEKSMLPGAPAGAANVARDQLRASLGDAVQMQLIRRKQPGAGGGFVPERGAIAVGRPLQLPESGVALGVSAPRVDLDFWRRALLSPSAAKTANAGAASAPPVDAVNLKTGELILLGRRFSDVDLGATASGSAWQIRLASREAGGDLRWDGAGRGKLSARFKHLAMEPSGAAPGQAPGEAIDELPALDIVADDFSVGARRFGRLEVQARNEARVWRLDKIVLSNPYGTLSGSGLWRFAGSNRTQLNFRLDSGDAGKLLDRLGYAGAVRGASAQLEGKIGWNAPPVDLDYATLSGEMKVDVGKGQFVKLDPGAGKLLGLISLQSLPRRISLDFRDVFSEGFAFDSIAGQLVMQNGMMRTDRLQIDGPAARVVMRGETDLQRETQRLTVNVQPELGGTAALGVALLNPVAGVAALLAHKILQNPLNQMFGFDYLVTGTWDDPKVEKLSRSEVPAAAGQHLPNLSTPSGAAHDATP
ncbi:MAG: TIGR02099 family protein [Candidatus Accumulibacter sp.]|nr:TIGR02099 family protein [Accumulibacter sp.]